MKNLLRLDRRFNISTKVFFLTFILVTSMIFLINFLYYQNSRNTLLNSQIESAMQFTSKSDEYLQLNLKNIQSFFLSVANDSKLTTGDYEQFDQWFNDNLILYIPNSKNIHLLKNNSVVVSTSSSGWLLEDDNEFKKQIVQIKESNQIYWSKPYFSAVSSYTVTAIMRIPSDLGDEILLALDLDLPRLYNSLLPSNSSSYNGNLVLLDYHNQAIVGSDIFVQYDSFQRDYKLYHVNEQFFEQIWLTREQSTNNKSYLFVRSQNNLLSWQVIWIIDKTELLKPLQKNIHYIWYLTGLSLLLSSIIAYTLSSFIGRPIRLIAKSMDQVGQGHWDTSIPIIRKDELGQLTVHFNRMTAKIRELISDLKKTEEAKKESDFLALQSQIRPHFIFNTLNSISMAARENHLEKVDLLISTFTKTIHYSLDNSPSPVTLDNELKALYSYIYLMQVRYDDQFNLETDIDPRTNQLLIPKFTLQPIVENSIFHGLIPSSNRGTLFIATERAGDSWDIIIEDTGIGIASDKRTAIMDELQRSNEHMPKKNLHIGLYNVHGRLKSMYGEQYQIKIESQPHMGTRIIFTLPIHSHLDGGEPQ